ncbi:ADP compounds hydrolase NudE [Magnetovirga frankeli]|uniref:ADP compounds hydrolase NudE n=1 Tax=Magnetovirga frankeli TaxID=947516 RepID=UPI0012934FAA|nr:ADP compounds hydrolase NudE [gamma proteobacterium SS-5]
MSKNSRPLPQIHHRELIADTGIFRVQSLELEFSNGACRRYQRILGSPQGAVLVVPLLDADTLLLIREYATAMERYELAFPKGHIEAGESAEQAANRELQEEVGYAAERLEPLDSVTLAPGYLQHTTHLVLARRLYPQRLPGDEPEPIEVVPWPLSRSDELLGRTDFTEARSRLALLLLQRHLNRPKE